MMIWNYLSVREDGVQGFHVGVSGPCPSAGIVEILLSDADSVAKLGFGKYRWPPQDGSRYLQRLPARMRTDDVAGMNAVVTPIWLLGHATDLCTGHVQTRCRVPIVPPLLHALAS